MRISIIAAAFAVACANDPVSVSGTSNRAMNVELLFEHDGCKVYRFGDNGRAHYYVHCRSGTATAIGSHSEEHGKSAQSAEEAIPTETR
jgi:hypothetical protein